MNLKRSPFAIQDKNARDLDNAKDSPTIADLMREQKVPQNYSNTVHHRRDFWLSRLVYENGYLLIFKN